jgi:hypothetical protein
MLSISLLCHYAERHYAVSWYTKKSYRPYLHFLYTIAKMPVLAMTLCQMTLGQTMGNRKFDVQAYR